MSDAAFPDGPFEDAAELTILMEAASSFEDMISLRHVRSTCGPFGPDQRLHQRRTGRRPDYLRVQRVRAILQINASINSSTNSTSLRPRAAIPRPSRWSAARVPLRTGLPAPRPPEAPPADNSQRAPDGVSSLCGLPALSVPCGFSSENLPYGIQFIGRAGNDHAVIDAAHPLPELDRMAQTAARPSRSLPTGLLSLKEIADHILTYQGRPDATAAESFWPFPRC